MKILRATDYRRVPWKNGGGTTSEIAVFPEGAGLADFGWRVSMADVSQDGPFSRFPGIDRTLTVLSGNGIELSVDGDAVRLTPTSSPHAFSGDADTRAALIGGPITDLNVMTRRGRYSHGVRSLSITEPLPIHSTETGTLIFCRTGGLNIEGVEIGAGDAVFMEEGSLIAEPNGETEILVVELAADR